MGAIAMSRWGKDHWSTLAYIETRIVDHGGEPHIHHLRCDKDLHPQFAHPGSLRGEKYPTRLVDGVIESHDDWSCLDDAEAEGLLRNVGTGFNRVYELTDLGMIVCNAIRNHKAEGGSFGNFAFTPLELVD
jgi:hypothetical protein